ncbi:acyltransferase [Leptolyngbya sp. Heron Island J]|uniref:acyltransferase family protein n=1 Tax=Leptolyngbya sp. Heron Island J TaxID=1385935 RepID=UPI0003B94FEB|nr:acyltransferase family protein [Leptolyngbya sp. Heron Island J]ESA36889.1 acyltransferase [Leptolyngbya sp. Heron Island J]
MGTRLVFLDNLRVFLTMLVVAHHAAQPYGPTGGAWPIFNPERAAILGAFFAVNAAFFMGLFFFISGYLLPAAYARKGAQQFLRSRFRRLGIPLLGLSIVVFPLVLYSVHGASESFVEFILQTYIQPLSLEVAHLWFLVHLLVYAVCYTLWQQMNRTDELTRATPEDQGSVPGHRTILIYLLVLSTVTFIVRIVYPIDRWVQLFGLIPAEIAHLPQYVSLFVLGIVAYQYNWLRRMGTLQGLTWLGIGLAAAGLRYGYSIGRARYGLADVIEGGGWDWRSALWSGWEATICVGLCIGLVTLFRKKNDFQSKILRILSDNAYMVYLIHLLPILYLQFMIDSISISPLAKFGIVTLVGLPLCFGCSMLLRRVPFVKWVVL